MASTRRWLVAKRRGYSLWEVVIASTLLTTVVTAVSVVARTGRQAWEAEDGDVKKLEAAHAAVRHLIRNIRQATDITAVSADGVSPGTLSLTLPSGSTVAYAYDGTNSVINYGVTTASSILADNITSLKFYSYKADGTTSTATATSVQLMKIVVGVSLTKDTNAARTVTGWVWVRAW